MSLICQGLRVKGLRYVVFDGLRGLEVIYCFSRG